MAFHAYWLECNVKRSQRSLRNNTQSLQFTIILRSETKTYLLCRQVVPEKEGLRESPNKNQRNGAPECSVEVLKSIECKQTPALIYSVCKTHSSHSLESSSVQQTTDHTDSFPQICFNCHWTPQCLLCAGCLITGPKSASHGVHVDFTGLQRCICMQLPVVTAGELYVMCVRSCTSCRW